MADLPAQLRREIRRTVALDILHHEAANELERLTTERDALCTALAHIERVMGPTVPPCCDGCHYEWGEVLKTVRAARKATP